MQTITDLARRVRRTATAFVAVGLITACGTVPPKPVVPDGATKVPVNTDERINEFKARLANEQQRTGEQRRIEREVDELRAQVNVLKTAALLLAQDAEGKSASPLPKPPSSVTPEIKSALAGVPAGTQLVISPPVAHAVPAKSAPVEPAVTAASAAPADSALKRPVALVIAPPATPAIAQASSPIIAPKAADVTAPAPALPAQAVRASTARLSEKPIAKTTDQPLPVASGNETTGVKPNGERSMIFRILQAPASTAFDAPADIYHLLVGAARASRQIIVRGRTQADTEDVRTLKLANERAANARAYLIANGVPPEIIWVNVMGAGGFAADNSTPEGRAVNSRVDIELVDLDPTPFIPKRDWRPLPDTTSKPLAAKANERSQP